MMIADISFKNGGVLTFMKKMFSFRDRIDY
jgi:hypothetical protein